MYWYVYYSASAYVGHFFFLFSSWTIAIPFQYTIAIQNAKYTFLFSEPPFFWISSLSLLFFLVWYRVVLCVRFHDLSFPFFTSMAFPKKKTLHVFAISTLHFSSTFFFLKLFRVAEEKSLLLWAARGFWGGKDKQQQQQQKKIVNRMCTGRYVARATFFFYSSLLRSFGALQSLAVRAGCTMLRIHYFVVGSSRRNVSLREPMQSRRTCNFEMVRESATVSLPHLRLKQ